MPPGNPDGLRSGKAAWAAQRSLAGSTFRVEEALRIALRGAWEVPPASCTEFLPVVFQGRDVAGGHPGCALGLPGAVSTGVRQPCSLSSHIACVLEPAALLRALSGAVWEDQETCGWLSSQVSEGKHIRPPLVPSHLE